MWPYDSLKIKKYIKKTKKQKIKNFKGKTKPFLWGLSKLINYGN
jgi:hypothetical protein